MSKCVKCGQATSKQRVCYDCRKAWIKNRTKTYEQALSELGPLTQKTLKSIQARVKELEKAHD